MNRHQEAGAQLSFTRLEETQTEIVQRLDRLINRVGRMERALDTDLEGIKMDLQRLAASVKKIEDAGDATIEMLGKIAAELRDIKDDPTEIEALAARIDAQAEELGAAVVANTPGDTTGGGGGEDTLPGEDTTGGGTGEDTAGGNGDPV